MARKSKRTARATGADAARGASTRGAEATQDVRIIDGEVISPEHRSVKRKPHGITVALEESATRPSRKSTRKSASHAKPSQGKERNAVAQSVTPKAQAARAQARRAR